MIWIIAHTHCSKSSVSLILRPSSTPLVFSPLLSLVFYTYIRMKKINLPRQAKFKYFYKFFQLHIRPFVTIWGTFEYLLGFLQRTKIEIISSFSPSRVIIFLARKNNVLLRLQFSFSCTKLVLHSNYFPFTIIE